MVGIESNGKSVVFSWADEVEKEEEAVAEAAEQQKQKPNPLGSARPREVVVQEKGIDWRKLQQQPASSLLRHEPQKYEKLRKQSNSHSKVSSQPQQIILTPQIRSPILVVPPLRYPPKYVAGIPYANAVESGFQRFKLEKENRSDGGAKKSHYSNTKSGPKIVGESAVYGNKPEADSSTRNGDEKFHGRNHPGLVQVNQNVRAPEMHAKRNAQDKAMEQKWRKVDRKPQYLSAKQVNHGGRDRASLGRTNKKNYEKKEDAIVTNGYVMLKF